MGVIRSGLFVILSVLLFLAFLVGNLFLTLNLSLDYENVKPELVSVVNQAVEKEINLIGDVDKNFELMTSYCQNNSEFVFNQDEYVFVLPCEVVSQGYNAVLNYTIDSFAESVYYGAYDCSFLDCIKTTETSFFFVSKQAKDYWRNKFYLLLTVSLILIAGMFFVIEKKHNLPIVVGSLLAVSSLPFMKLPWLLSFMSDSNFLQFFTIFFSKSYTVFLIAFLLGLLTLATGIILKFFHIGFKINNFFSRFSKGSKDNKKISKGEVKSIVKQEISKSKK